MTIVRVTLDDNGIVRLVNSDGSRIAIEGRTDWTKLDNMTEEEIERNALDEDSA